MDKGLPRFDAGEFGFPVVSPARCANTECHHTLDVPRISPANYTVSVAAVNVVGESRSTESRTISKHTTLRFYDTYM